jgi:hypothetical protein
MKKINFVQFFLTLLFACSSTIIAQIENIKADHQVYPFLKKMQVQGILENYDDMILPYSRSDVNKFLSSIDKKRNELSNPDREFLDRMKIKFYFENENWINVFDNFPENFGENLIIDKQKHLYDFRDSVVRLYIDPLFEFKSIYSSTVKSTASLLNFGGLLAGSYDDWLGFSVQGTNGFVYGNRTAARLDKRVEQSFTFNDTKINYFDGTEGYLKLQKNSIGFQLGRERILWGRGYLNKMILSDNPQLFDFVKFNASYKSLRYDFIHAWLVQPKMVEFISPQSGEFKNKDAKYLAASRLSYTPNTDLSFAVSQIIIYANRPFEAAYLNPFLFWESAQRSMNDLDNSFLSFDGRFKPADGLEINSAVLIDDINFGKIFKNWSTIQNRIAWQAGAMLTSPILIDDLTLKLEYLQIRPYIFVHPGLGESLTYTNNSYMLGFDLPPNSIRFSAEAEYRFSGRLNLIVRYDHSIHGNNIYDENGNLIKNVGGNIFENNNINDSDAAYLLDGNREVTDNFILTLNYELFYGYYFEAQYQFFRDVFNEESVNQNTLWGSFRIIL